MSKIDLHIHTCFSDDGEFTPHEIMEQCKALNMEIIAVTDHNSVRGVSGAMESAGEMRVLSGVELDCSYGGRNFHLLGYGFDWTRKEFAEMEQDILRQEIHAAEEKISLFRKAVGIPVAASEVLEASGNGVVTGELIAEIVLAREDAETYEALRPYLPGGEKSDMPNVRLYWDFFSEGKPAYVPIRYLPLPDAVSLIHQSGGLAVLAHPGQNLNSRDPLLTGILSEKIDGIEAFSSYHRPAVAKAYLETAEQNRLLVTCGSDFHGKHKPNIRIGGHEAFWKDQQLRAGLETRLLGKA